MCGNWQMQDHILACGSNVVYEKLSRSSRIYNKLSCVLTFIAVVCGQESEIEHIVPIMCDIDDIVQWTFDLISRTSMCTGGGVLFMAVSMDSVAEKFTDNNRAETVLSFLREVWNVL